MYKIIDIKDLNGREVAVGEKIMVNGEVYECKVEVEGCKLCSFSDGGVCRKDGQLRCAKEKRKDRIGVIYVKPKQIESNETEELNIAEILKDCPIGTKLYSPILGEVTFFKLSYVNPNIDICVLNSSTRYWFNSKGQYLYTDGECMLFPSKDQRDWSKFKLSLKPPFEIKRVEIGELYYVISIEGDILEQAENGGYWDKNRYNYGNYFNTKEQAKYAAEKVKELLLSLRKEE